MFFHINSPPEKYIRYLTDLRRPPLLKERGKGGEFIYRYFISIEIILLNLNSSFCDKDLIIIFVRNIID